MWEGTDYSEISPEAIINMNIAALRRLDWEPQVGLRICMSMSAWVLDLDRKEGDKYGKGSHIGFPLRIRGGA